MSTPTHPTTDEDSASRFPAEALVQALFEASPDCVEILDRDGRLLAINPSGHRVRGFEVDGVFSAERALRSEPGETRDRWGSALEAARQGRSTSFVAEVVTAAGVRSSWSIALSPVFEPDGVVAGVVAVSRDVTAAVRREDELHRRIDEQGIALVVSTGRWNAERRQVEISRARLAHTEKLRVLGQFVGSLVHDINNVLASMAGAVRLLRRKVEDPKTLEILSHVDHSVERGVVLVRRLLDFSRVERTEPERLDVGATIDRDIELLRLLVGPAIELEIDRDADLWPVLVAPDRLLSVLFNFVANARDALDGVGHVRIHVCNRSAGSGDHASVGVAPRGDHVSISVIDDGPGMSAEVIARLGEPFFTTKAPGKGTGLGVPSAFELADQADGTVEIESTLGVGTRMTLHLPRA